jgi:NAD(P)-dependent dehydrogenase (short-subunit alcohol dehydrogenase family)
MRLQDKVCIITGAANGIGTAHAKRFAAEGATVALADLDGEGAERVAAEIGGSASGHFVDIAQDAACEQLVDEVLEAHGRIDVLVNNAAIYRGVKLLDTTPEYLAKLADVNLWGVWRMTRAAARPMIRQRSGSVINQSSDAAYMYTIYPTTGEELPNFGYGITKWGVNGLTKFMAGALGPHGINVNCISPGVVLTEATKEVVPDDQIEMIAAGVPLRRSLQPEDITGAAVFFASEDASLITGQILCVDAGASMPG